MLHVGISGPIASGKSTLAKKLTYLAEDNGYAAEIIAFAAGIRQLIALEEHPARVILMSSMITDWGWDSTKAHLAAIMIDDYMREYPSTPGVKNRRLLQFVGTEVGREFIDKDFWIYRTQQLFRSHPVIDYGFSDDLRFDNEVHAVDVHIRIIIPKEREECYTKRLVAFGSGYTFNGHASERSLTLPPLYTIPVCFTDAEVVSIYDKLDSIRRLRY